MSPRRIREACAKVRDALVERMQTDGNMCESPDASGFGCLNDESTTPVSERCDWCRWADGAQKALAAIDLSPLAAASAPAAEPSGIPGELAAAVRRLVAKADSARHYIGCTGGPDEDNEVERARHQLEVAIRMMRDAMRDAGVES